MRSPKDIEKYQEHYSEPKFAGKLVKVAKSAGRKMVYAALLLYYVLKSPSVKKGDKTTIIGALGYFILPLDILPDFIPMVGFTDDLSAILLALHAVWKNITPEIKAMAAAKASELFGDFNQQEIDDQLGR
jgi:uncharacterized membrane protein YkvA (DUF1232 family)